MTRRTVQPLEGDFQHQPLLARDIEFAHRPEPVARVGAHISVKLFQLLVGEAEIGLAHRHEFLAAPDAECVIRIEGRALAVAALRIHQHGVDVEGFAFPLEPQAFRATRHIEAVAPLEHHALDRPGVFARSCASRIAARSGKIVPGRKIHQRRQIEPRMRKALHDRGETLTPFDKAQRPQVLAILRQNVIGPDLRGILRDKFRRHSLAVEPLLQDGKRLHQSIIHDQQFAVDGDIAETGVSKHVDQIGEGARDILARA